MLAGATPVLADVDPVTYTLTPAAVAQNLTRRTRAIIPVHLYGQAADMTGLLSLARARRLSVVEDACQALGATWEGKPVGALGDAGCFSFFPTKNLGGIGDGGMVVTNRPEVAARVKRLRNHGCEEKYRHLELGYNSRLDEVQSAVLRVKLPYLNRWNEKRRQLAQVYLQNLDANHAVLPAVRPGAEHVFHQFAIQVEQRDACAAYLKNAGVETAVHYPLALHQQPLFAHLPSAKRKFPVAENLARRVLCLPITPEISGQQVRQVARGLHQQRIDYDADDGRDGAFALSKQAAEQPHEQPGQDGDVESGDGDDMGSAGVDVGLLEFCRHAVVVTQQDAGQQ